jgi:hypothetical protein
VSDINVGDVPGEPGKLVVSEYVRDGAVVPSDAVEARD